MPSRPAHLALLAAVTLLAAAGCGDATASTGTPSAPATTAAAEPARSVAGLPGTLFYFDDDAGALVRLNLDGTRTPAVKGDGAAVAAVSPDGQRVAWTEDDGDLWVSAVGGRDARRLARRTGGGYGFDPVWSADGTRILTGAGDDPSSGASKPVVVTVSDGTVTPLPAAFDGGIHPRWSGDGREVFWIGECDVRHAHADGTATTTVPVLGSENAVENPTQARTCDLVGVDATGARIAVDLHVGDEPDGDVAGSRIADTVIDVATGAPWPLPVRGTVRALRYRADGTLLVRTETGGGFRLTLLSPTGEELAAATEPPSVRGLDLYDWTR